jgi:hypothetical protein
MNNARSRMILPDPGIVCPSKKASVSMWLLSPTRVPPGPMPLAGITILGKYICIGTPRGEDWKGVVTRMLEAREERGSDVGGFRVRGDGVLRWIPGRGADKVNVSGRRG